MDVGAEDESLVEVGSGLCSRTLVDLYQDTCAHCSPKDVPFHKPLIEGDEDILSLHLYV